MEIIYTTLQWTIFGMGVLAVCLSFYFIYFFSKATKHKGLSLTMQFFLCEQVVCAVGTLIFASNSLISTLKGMDHLAWNSMPPLAAISIRAAMFGAMIFSTYRLSREILQVSRDLSDCEEHRDGSEGE